ncbi:MAG: dolichyl-diphosphooligosaccharide--protein glycosyltransferase subunit STT3 [Methanobrevibacter sp.]|jgi:dolichyl-diphosphooligosaccharide--protein glycosyltransferase|nr:dolichyl-diphosphooligosaccharide--protein glycosyltransferase subunit STT3 [Candidatus Methanovirga meridionalis]
MDREKKKKIIKTAGIIVALVLIAFVLRAQTYDMSAFPQETKEIFTDSDGLPYFSEMDSYYHLRLIENFVDHGYFGDTIVNNSQWDNHRLSPDGIEYSYQPMIFYVTLLFYNLVNLIFHGIPIKFVAYWTGAILGSLVVIPAFIIVRRITNAYGGVVAALLVAMSPNFFAHTFAGFYDTDMFTVLLPLIMLFFFIESIRNKNPKFRIISGILTAITVIVFSLSWASYIFYPAIFVFAIIMFLVLGLIFKIRLFKPIKDYPNIKTWFINQKEISAITIILIVSFIGLSFTVGLDNIINSIFGLFGSLNLQSAGGLGNYPNVAVSIGELQKPAILSGGLFGLFSSSSGGIINGVGGILVFFASLFMIFIFIHSFWNLRNIRNKDLKGKKLPKSKRKSGGNIIKAAKNKGFIEKFADLTINNNVEESKKEMLLYITTFGSWILITLVASFTGSRFIAFFVIPIALTAGIFVGYIYQYIKKYTENNNLLYISILSSLLISYSLLMVSTEFLYPLIVLIVLILLSYLLIYGQKTIFSNIKKLKRLNRVKGSFVVLLLSLALIAPTITGAYYVSTYSQPGTSDPMWNSMENIKATQPNDTVIASWWDYGYLFEIAANRMTVFDGGSQSGERAYWMGKAILTSDDKLSSAILKMLATTGNRAIDALNNYTNDKGKAAMILEDILPKSKTEANNTLISSYNLTTDQANTIVNYSHPNNPRPVVFVMSSDMISKAGVWSNFGSWDFEAQEGEISQYITNPQSSSPMTQNETGNITEMINYQQGEGNNSVVFKTIFTKYTNGSTDIKFVASHDDGTPILLQDGSEFKPQFNGREILISDAKVVENGNLTDDKTLNEGGDYSLLILGNDGIYQSILMSKDLSNSMFTKLYLTNGAGQSSFENVGNENGVSLWKIK